MYTINLPYLSVNENVKMYQERRAFTVNELYLCIEGNVMTITEPNL